MKILKFLKISCSLAMLIACMALLGAWDMQLVSATPVPEVWNEGMHIPEATSGYAAAQCSDDPDGFYMIGGIIGNWYYSNNFFYYDSTIDDWDLTLPPLPVHECCMYATCYQGKIYVAGGWANVGYQYLYIYDIASQTWISGANTPRPVSQAALGAWDGKLYLVGGSPYALPSPPVPDVDIYDIASNTWYTQAGADMPEAASSPGAVQAGQYLYLTGGLSGNYAQNIDVTQRYDMANNQWDLPIDFPSARAGLALALAEHTLYAVAGDLDGGDLEVTNLVESLDLNTWPSSTWQIVDDPLPISVFGINGYCTKAVTGGEIWSPGGGYIDEYGNTIEYDTNYYRPMGESCFDFSFGDLKPESLATTGMPGEIVTYALSIHNDGNLTDTYDISASVAWTTTFPASVGPIAPGESAGLVVNVEIPAGGAPGESDTAILTATSQADLSASDSALITTTVSSWMEVTSLPIPLAANLVQCVDMPGSFYMVGGILPGNVTSNRLYKYDIGLGEWVRLADLPEPRRTVAATCYQGKIYAAGGWNSGVVDTLFIYDILGDTWTVGPPLPDIVWTAVMGAWDGKLYVIGGTRGGSPYTPVNRVDVFDITSGAWTAGGGQDMPTAASFFSAVQTGPYLYMAGGYSGDFAHNVDQTQRYDMENNEWEIGPQFTSARAYSPMAASSSHLYALGGEMDGGSPFDTTDLVEVLDLSTWPDGSWTDFNDPLPDPNLGPSTACSELLTGGEIWAVGGLDPSSSVYDTNYYHPINDACFDFYFGDLEPESLATTGMPGEIVTYTLSIHNDGTLPDSYDISASAVWTTTHPATIGPLGPGESIEIEITTEVPPDAMWGDLGVTEITATSIGNPAAFDTTSITTTVLGYEFEINPTPPDPQAGHPGDVLVYALVVSNIGDFEDSYTVTVSATWETVAPILLGPILPGEVVELAVEVTIPQEAMAGDWDFAILNFTSQADPRISHEVTLSSTAFWYRTLLPLSLKN
jgi:N-acetylneuraminic acid mutarotase